MSARREKHAITPADAEALKVAAAARRQAAETEAARKRLLGEAVQRAVTVRAESLRAGKALDVEAARAVAAEAIEKTRCERRERSNLAHADLGITTPGSSSTTDSLDTGEPQRRPEANEPGMSAAEYEQRYLGADLDAAAMSPPSS